MGIKNELLKKLRLLLMLTIATWLIVFATNYVAQELRNGPNEYRSFYDASIKKGFLSEKDVLQLEILKEKYLADSKRRNREFFIYFSSLFIGMSLFFTLAYFIGGYSFTVTFRLILIGFVFMIAGIATSIVQGLFWTLFF